LDKIYFLDLAEQYGTGDFALYAYSAMFILADNVGAICCGRPVAELLYRDYSDIFTHFEFLIAIAIRNGDADVIAYLKDAIYGDNAASALDHHLVRGIVRSGNEELVGDLLRLLDAARAQEGNAGGQAEAPAAISTYKNLL